MKTRLKHITNIQTGVFAKPLKEGQIVYLQAKHFDDNGLLRSLLHPDLLAENISNKHLLQPDDVLFAAKGTKNFAAWYQSNNLPAVASTSFFVIRLKETIINKILPEFLAWYINQSVSQKFLKSYAMGTSIASISKAVLGELEISIPDLQMQKTVLKIAHLRNSGKKLQQQIDMLRDKQIQQELVNAIK